MSVVGIDIGNYNTCIAVARNRGIDIVTNDVSNRFTPTMLSFNGDQRFLGEGAKTQEIMNFKNTVTSLKRLIGRDFAEEEVQKLEKGFVNFNLVEADNKLTAAKVTYQGTQQVFDTTQLLAMYLTHLKQTAEASLENTVSAAVFSVPAYFTDRQRHAIMTAAEIANLNCVRLINEPTAAALAYGITRVSDFPEKDPRNVVFIDIGHAAMTVSIAGFTKEKAEIKATAFDRSVGGRVIDDLIVKHFVEKIKEKHKTDITDNVKAMLRLKVACEKLKHVLSANAQAALQIECLTDVLDINFVMKREELEQLAGHLLERITAPIKIALHDAGLKKEDVHFVEIIGGSTRIPSIQQRIADFFERPEVLSKTLNMDEAIARGAALQCAITSPLFKVREYQIKDVSAYSIKVSWDPTENQKTTESVLFKKASSVPSKKTLTLKRAAPFQIRVQYAEVENLPAGSNPFIGHFMINDVKPSETGEPQEVKITARLNESCVFSIESVELVEKIITSTTPMEVDAGDAKEAQPEGEEKMDVEEGPTKEFATKTVKKPLTFTTSSSALTPQELNRLREIEGQMIASDKLILATQEKKNSLESYIYEMRNKIEGSHSEFLSPKVKETFSASLNDTENWLYDNGDTAKKSEFEEKLSALQKVGQPMEVRYREAEDRPAAITDLKKAIEQFKALATTEDAKYEHIDAADRQRVLAECEKREKWLAEQLAAQDKLTKADDPKVLTSQIKSQRETLVMMAAPVMNKPKPKPKEEPPKEAAAPAKEEPKAEPAAATPEAKADPMNVNEVD